MALGETYGFYSDQVFRWRVSMGSGRTVDFANDEIQFGDGYEQIVGRGINTEMREWQISLDRRSWHEIREAHDWLIDRAGRTSFYFVPEDTGIPIRVRTSGQIAMSIDNNAQMTLRCTFREWRGA